MIVNLVLILVSVFMVVGLANSPSLPAGLVFFTVVFIGGTILWVFRHVIRMAYLNSQVRKASERADESSKKVAELEKKRHQDKQAEIAALPPVERMTARIDTGDKSVSLYLQLSEVERQTIIKYDLDQVVFEEYREFDDDHIAQFKIREAEELAAIRGYSDAKMLQRKMSAESAKRVAERMKTAKVEVRLIDYMAYPYTRYFNTTPEATQYAAKLKQILPKIKEMVDAHASHQSSEMIQL